MVEITTSGKRLLVVDDDRLICWAMEQEFSAHGLASSHSYDGKDAIAKIRAATYDVALVDVNLPDANGIALLDVIRQVSPATRAIVMSADADPAAVRRAIAAGAVQFFEKPFEPAAICGQVLEMLRDYPVPRRHPRFSCRIPMRISLLAPLPPGAAYALDNVTGVAENVASGGLLVAIDYPLAAGQVIRVKTGDAAAAAPFANLFPAEATGEIRWATLAPGGFRAGLSFTSPPDPRGA